MGLPQVRGQLTLGLPVPSLLDNGEPGPLSFPPLSKTHMLESMCGCILPVDPGVAKLDLMRSVSLDSLPSACNFIY